MPTLSQLLCVRQEYWNRVAAAWPSMMTRDMAVLLRFNAIMHSQPVLGRLSSRLDLVFSPMIANLQADNSVAEGEV
jgi:hypothetical protein